jgi:hypothetical protein
MPILKIGSVRGGFVLLFTVAIFGSALTVQPPVTAARSCGQTCSRPSAPPPPPSPCCTRLSLSSSHQATGASALDPLMQMPPKPLSDRRVILYGDSLGWESQAFFVAELARAAFTEVTTRTFGGTAICDWIGQMRLDAATLRPDAVVVEFSGNALTPCMRGAGGAALSGSAYFRKYASDAAAVLQIFTPGHTFVFFVGTPISLSAERAHNPTNAILRNLYASVAKSNPYGRYVDAGASVLLDGRWTETLACLPAEPCTGGRDAGGIPVNVVRAPDGAHFCPGAPAAVRGVTDACRVWSSGAWRFGNAMAMPVVAQLTELSAV